MKKLVLSVATLGIMSLTSCVKLDDHTCVCTYTENGVVLKTEELKIEKTREKDAKETCDGKGISPIPGTVIKCELK